MGAKARGRGGRGGRARRRGVPGQGPEHLSAGRRPGGGSGVARGRPAARGAAGTFQAITELPVGALSGRRGRPAPSSRGRGGPGAGAAPGPGGVPSGAGVPAKAAQGRAHGGRGTRCPPGARRGSSTWRRSRAPALRSAGGRAGVARGPLGRPLPSARAARRAGPGRGAGRRGPRVSPPLPHLPGAGGVAGVPRARAVRQVPARARAGCRGAPAGGCGPGSPGATRRAGWARRRCPSRGTRKELPAPPRLRAALPPPPPPPGRGSSFLPEGIPVPRGPGCDPRPGFLRPRKKGSRNAGRSLPPASSPLKQGVEKSKDKWPG